MSGRLGNIFLILMILAIGLLIPVTAKSALSIGPFVVYNADSSSSIRLQFVGQLKATLESRDNGTDVSRTDKYSMQGRRIRFTLSGTVYDADLSYKVHLSTAPKSLELMDFYFNYQYCSCLQFRFGQYKTPFTRYRIQSFQRLIFADWAIVTKYFGAERQMGFAFHNGYEQPPQYGYIFGVFSGMNARAAHAVGISEMYGEKVSNPSDLANPGAMDKFHPELFLHLSYSANGIKVSTNSDEAKTGLRYSFGLSGAWDLFPTKYYDFSLRLAPEFLVKYRGIALVGIGYAGYSKIGKPSENKLAMTGGLVQAAYRLNSTYEVAVRYALVDFTSKLTDDAADRATQLIADSGDDPDVIVQYGKAGKIKQQQELTAVFAVYFIGNYLKWVNDFGWLRHCYADENRDDYQWRSQFQISF
jgi:hypothetical protein